MEKLRDIKPLVEIPDYSFYLYLFLIFLATLAAALFVYLLIRIATKKKIDKRKQIVAQLNRLDLNDAKHTAYTITKLGRYVIKDSSSLRIYEELLKRLAKYKYKKEVPPLDDETKKYIKLFLKMINE